MKGISTKGESPVARDCVVELVGLEPTTKVLWNMVRVRPTTPVGHLSGPETWVTDRTGDMGGQPRADRVVDWLQISCSGEHLWHGHCSLARAFAVNPARQEARPFGLRGLTAQRGQARGLSCQECGNALVRVRRLLLYRRHG